MRRKARGIFLIVLGLVLSVSAAVIFAMYERQAAIAGENAEIMLDNLTETIQRREEESHYDPAQREEPVENLPQVDLGGYAMIGIIRVPALGLELPLQNEWSYDLLQISPCRYSGSVQGGDLILLGHDYERHFGPLKKIGVGDTVELCDVNAAVYTYRVVATEILQKTELERLTSTDYDLTIFTCTNGGYSRFVVRCERVIPGDTDENNQNQGEWV